jgi:hypothetical protein
MFLRGKPLMVAYVVRKAIKGTGPRRPSTNDPNFYVQHYLEATPTTTTPTRNKVLTSNSLVIPHRSVPPTPRANDILPQLRQAPATAFAVSAVREQDAIGPQAAHTPVGNLVHDSAVDMMLVALLQQRLAEQENALIRFLRSREVGSGLDLAFLRAMYGNQLVERNHSLAPLTNDRNTGFLSRNDLMIWRHEM